MIAVTHNNSGVSDCSGRNAGYGLLPGLIFLGLILLSSGCAQVPPTNITRDRFEYGETLAESWKRQTLINIARLRYADVPLFMDVSSIINSYSHAGTFSAGGIARPIDPAGGEFAVGSSGTWSNTPTVTYQPLGGDKFTRSLLRPIPPTAIFQLLQAGWPANLIFRLTLRSINNLPNRGVGSSEIDPRFDQSVQLVDQILRSHSLGMRVEERKDGEGTVMIIRKAESQQTAEDIKALAAMWGLDPGVSEFSVTFGGTPRNGREVSVLTRSMLEIMVSIALDIEVPPQHLAERRVLSGGPVISGNVSPLIRIQSGKTAPADAFVAVPYRDHWFWIDDSDVASKVRFTFLMILFSLAETGATAGAPVVTVPSR